MNITVRKDGVIIQHRFSLPECITWRLGREVHQKSSINSKHRIICGSAVVLTRQDDPSPLSNDCTNEIESGLLRTLRRVVVIVIVGREQCGCSAPDVVTLQITLYVCVVDKRLNQQKISPLILCMLFLK